MYMYVATHYGQQSFAKFSAKLPKEVGGGSHELKPPSPLKESGRGAEPLSPPPPNSTTGTHA